MEKSILKHLLSLEEIFSHYDYFIIDQWGVIHDGSHVFEAARAALSHLMIHRKKVVLLSNSSRMQEESLSHLEKLNLRVGQHFDTTFSSGDHLKLCFEKKTGDSFYLSLGSSYFWVADMDDGEEFIKGTSFYRVSTLEEASFVIVRSVQPFDNDGETYKPENYDPFLQRMRQRNLPFICPNSDRFAPHKSGKLHLCPGAVAERYETMGGFVRWHGKPRKEMYDWALHIAQIDPMAKGLAIGDSLLHDIVGGQKAGLDTLFITTGVHKDYFQTRKLSLSSVESLCQSLGLESPTYFMKALQ